MSRRIESKRSRLRKKVYMASLEVKAKELEVIDIIFFFITSIRSIVYINL